MSSAAPRWAYKKVGGLHFVRVWRFGFSFYIARA